MDHSSHLQKREKEKSSDQQPATLYKILCRYFARHLSLPSDLHLSIIADIQKSALYQELKDQLRELLSNLVLLEKLLNYRGYRNVLYKCLCTVRKKDRNFQNFLVYKKIAHYKEMEHHLVCGTLDIKYLSSFLDEVLNLGDFLHDNGFYDSPSVLYKNIHIVDVNGNIPKHLLEISFEITLRLVRSLTLHYKHEEAKKAICNTRLLLNQIQQYYEKPNCCLFYTTCSIYLFSLSHYDKAFNLSMQAIAELNKNLPRKVILLSLRQACKTCLLKRLFHQASVFVQRAMSLALRWFGSKDLQYADCLTDFGSYLLSIDSVSSSVKYYRQALSIRQDLLGEDNILTAISHEDLAYAIYVRDYSYGGFKVARVHAEEALLNLTKLLPNNHLALASSKRVLALILEEEAIDSSNNEKETQLLQSAEALHIDALKLSKKTFGEDNLQTAKHYGNLGRLYQSMKKFKESEKHHLIAIRIKEKLLGKEDYEVALSIGHLASLYNYDMSEYDFAEELYLRSISIGQKLFGSHYSGLEYDYRGLIHLYTEKGCSEKMYEYHRLLMDWKIARNDILSSKDESSELENDLYNVEKSIDEIVSEVKLLSKNHSKVPITGDES